jgi:mannose-6-phosphate isomerase-like protein (cupin superfamily)
METALRPYAIHRDEGERLSFVGALTWIKATGAQTGGAFGLIEQLMPPGRESAWHRHHNEDESFYVIEGEVLFIIGDEGQQRITTGPGTFVFGPREIPHGFRVQGSSPAQMLTVATPAGFENFVLALSEPAPASGFPPAGPPDMEKVMAASARANLEILGPLPE